MNSTASSINNSLGSSDEDSAAPVFLVGPPRSGTTWLQGMLANHPDIGTAQESHLFNQFLQPMMDQWDAMVNFDDGRGGIGLPAYQTHAEFLQMVRSIALDVYRSVPEYHSNTLFLDKTPDHIRCIKTIWKVFPDAKIIVLLRNPEDVIESLMNASKSWGKNWAPSSIISAIRTYQYFFKVEGTNELILNDPRLCMVRYEQMKDNPVVALGKILEYLHIPADEQVLQRMSSSPHQLKKYGEFGNQTGNVVIEPDTFARKKKGQLNWIQKRIISTMLAQHMRDYNHTKPTPTQPNLKYVKVNS